MEYTLKERFYFLLFHCSMNCKKCVYGKIEFDKEKGYKRERCYKLPNKPIWGSKAR